jgi:ketosteroid isomerase-like protein
VPESNAETMRKMFDGYAAEGWEAMLPVIGPDFELTTPPGLAAEPDTYSGQDGIRRYFESFYEVMDEVRFDPHEYREVSDWVVIPFRLTARGRATGLEAGIDGVMAWRLRDGLAVRCLVFAELEEALAEVEKLRG